MITRIKNLMILLLVLFVTGCGSTPIAGTGQIRFREIFDSQELSIENTQRLNLDHDSDNEWMVLYRYDETQNGWGNTPVQGIVYDAAPCEPPLIHNLLLPFPNNDYLGEGRNNVDGRMIVSDLDRLKTSDPNEAPNELLIYDRGPVETLSIYRLNDQEQNPCKGPDPDKRKFNLHGFFRANGFIDWEEPTDTEPLTIRTYERTSYERSQLAIRSTYKPISNTSTNHNETFIVPGTERTIAPIERSIDFLYGQPASPQDSPYPEKSVAAFYLSLGQDNERARSFLHNPPDEATFEDTSEKWGLEIPPSQIQKVLIYSITYEPDIAKERAHETRNVTVKIQVVGQNGKKYDPRIVTWEVLGVPITEGDLDCEWRLKEVTDVVITPGLG